MANNLILNHNDFNSLGFPVNQATIRSLIKDSTTLDSIISAGTLGIYIIGYASPTHSLLPGLAHGDLVRVTGANQCYIFATYAQAPPALNYVAAGTYNGVFVKTGDLIHRWTIYAGVATFSNANFSIPTYAANIILQIGTLTAQRIVTLPKVASTPIGYTIRIIDASGTASVTTPIRINADSTDTINGNNSSTLPIFITQPYGSVDFISDGVSKWTAIQNKLLSTAIAQFAAATISALGNLNFSAVTISNNGASGGSGNIVWSSGTANKFTLGSGRWRVISNIGVISGSNGYVQTALCSTPSGTDLGPVWANGFVMNTGRATDWSSNFGGWNEFNVAAGSTQDCYFRVWAIGGAINIDSKSFLTIQQLS